MLTAGRVACGILKNPIGLPEASSNSAKAKERAPKKGLPNSGIGAPVREKNVVLKISQPTRSAPKTLQPMRCH